jgi:hypothetical protein
LPFGLPVPQHGASFFPFSGHVAPDFSSLAGAWQAKHTTRGGEAWDNLLGLEIRGSPDD